MGEQANQGRSVAAGDFSLVLGGPLFQLFRRAHLTGGALELLHRRIIVLVLVAWVPLLVLSFLDGVAVGAAVKVPFLFDVDLHARFLLSLPILIAVELIVDRRTRIVVQQFVAQGLVADSLRPRFDAAIASAVRLRNSIVAELVLIAVVYGVGIFVVWRYYMVLEVPTWYATPEAGLVQPKLAGWWYFFVSLPIYQFILLRWYFRFVVWTRFMWHASRMPLAYQPLHPDGNGGIGFLAGVTRAFAPLLFAQGALLAGTLANTILYEGEVLTHFYVEVVLFAAFSVFVIVAPLLLFTFPLAAAKRKGVREYAQLSRRYADEFAAKWIHGTPPAGEALIGSGDIQSLADLGNSYDKVRGMSIVPITRGAVAQLVIAALLPLVPLLLTLISFEELLKRIVKVLV
jgi:hypothetical protein